MEMDFPGSAGDSGDSAVYRHRRRAGDAACGIGCCRRSLAGARLPSGKRSEFWRCAGSCSADLDATVLGRSNFRRRMAERWERMTPEERERFRQGMRARCGFGPSTSESKGQ